MKKQLLIVYLFIFYAIPLFCVAQGKFSKWDFSYQYDSQALIRTESKAVKNGDSILIFLHFYINPICKEYSMLTKQGMWNFGLRLTDSYESKNSEWAKSELIIPLFKTGNQLFFSFKIPQPKSNSAILYVGYLANDHTEYVTDICLKSFGEYLISTSYIANYANKLPICSSYLSVKDSVFFVSDDAKTQTYNYTKYIFSQAQPPMAQTATFDAGLNLVIDTSYTTSNPYFVIPKKGNYSIGDGYDKVNFVAFENKFPKPSIVRELIDPLIYISSDGERTALKLAISQKKKLDEFWLKLGIYKEKTK